MPEQEQRQQPCGQRVCEGSAGEGADVLLFNHVEIKVPVDPHMHMDCVYLPMVSQTVGSERGDGLECRGGIIICGQWMSCETDFYIV